MLDVREIGKLVLEVDFTVAGALAVIPPDAVAAAIERFSAKPPALKDAEPKLDGPKSLEVRNRLKTIGVGAWPRMPDQTGWLNANLLALSDLSPRVLVLALDQAIHRPYQFENEVQGVVREIATKIMDQQAFALFRLREMQREIVRAASTANQIEHQPELWTEESIAEANVMFRRLAIDTRYRLGPDGTCEAVTVAEVPDPEAGIDKPCKQA